MKSSEKVRRRMFTRPFFLHNRIAFAVAAAATVATGAVNLLISWLMQQILDLLSGTNTTLSLGGLVLVCCLTITVLGGTMMLDRWASPRFLRRAMRQYKETVFEQITRKSIHSFNRESTATYLSALTNDATVIEQNYLSKLFPLIQQGVMFVGAFAMMLCYSPGLTLAAVLFSLAPVLASVLIGGRMAAREKEVSDRNESFLAMLKDTLSGFAVIKSFKAEREMLRIFTDNNRQLEHAKCRRRRTEILLQMIAGGAGIMAQFGVFLFGAYMAVSGEAITAGVVIAFVQLMNFVVGPIGEVPQILAGRRAAAALIDKMASAVAENVREPSKAGETEGASSQDARLPSSKETSSPERRPALREGIRLRQVGFSYEPGTPVLRGVDACLEAGRSYALVGGSGSGKSTLLNLLMGSSTEYSGQILLDGRELRDVPTDSLYEQISIIQQNVFIFNGTVRDNITLYRSFPEEQIQRAMTLSGLDEFVAARGADYRCGENGSGLSGGERQRISIARCLLRNTPVLLADEATASLDAATASEVSEALLNMKELTRVIVTHRLEESLLRKYDRILVLRGGVLEEQGTFAELMEHRGYFYSLFVVSQ